MLRKFQITNFEFWKLAEVIRNIIDEWHRKSANWWTDDIYRSDLYPIYSWAISSRWRIGIFCKTPSNGGGMCRVGGCADGSPQLPPLQVYKCVCVWVCLINNAGHSFGVLETVSNATWMFIFESLRFWFEFWLNALAVQFLLKFIWENENNNTIIISKRKQWTAGGSRKSCGRGREEGEEKQTNLSCDILLDFSFI